MNEDTKELGKLLGKTVLEVLSDPDKVMWRFVTDQGNLDYYCYGDCCSESWVNHINDVNELIGGRVLDLEEVDMYGMLDVQPEPTRQDYDQVMFHRVRTDKGTCIIEFRNSSNGYYGGNFEEADGFLGDKYFEEVELTPVTEDF